MTAAIETLSEQLAGIAIAAAAAASGPAADIHCRLVRDDSTAEYKVIAKSWIPSGTYVGQLVGRPVYSWDIPQLPQLQDPGFFVVDDDCVLDLSGQQDNIAAYMRDAMMAETQANCELLEGFQETDGLCSIYIRTSRNIYPGEELAYALFSR